MVTWKIPLIFEYLHDYSKFESIRIISINSITNSQLFQSYSQTLDASSVEFLSFFRVQDVETCHVTWLDSTRRNRRFVSRFELSTISTFHHVERLARSDVRPIFFCLLCGYYIDSISRQLVRDMAPVINPEEDYLTIVAAEEQIAATHAKRKKELEDAHAKLKGTCPDHLPVDW